MAFKEKLVIFFATGCFSGNIPFAPGTFGSLTGIPICFLLSCLNLWVTVFFSVCFIFFAVLIARSAEKILQKEDPGSIVIDEIAGLMVTFIGLPFNFISVGVGFCIFRMFDIFKPFPIRTIETRLKGGSAIVLDDVAAGIYSNLLLRIFIILMGATYE